LHLPSDRSPPIESMELAMHIVSPRGESLFCHFYQLFEEDSTVSDRRSGVGVGIGISNDIQIFGNVLINNIIVRNEDVSEYTTLERILQVAYLQNYTFVFDTRLSGIRTICTNSFL